MFNTKTKKAAYYSCVTEDGGFVVKGTYKGSFKSGQKIKVTMKDGSYKYKDTILIRSGTIGVDIGTNGYYTTMYSISVEEAMEEI